MNLDLPQIEVSPWLIALAVMLATFMEALDTSIANVALDHIAGSLSVSTEEATWVLTSYLISNGIIIPTTAWFGQRFGRKRFLMACVAIFTVSSLLCGLATSLPMLLVMRIIQGAGGGALQPISQAILLESFPKEKHGQAMSAYGLGVVVAPILGPVLGGFITDNYSWRWIFLMNVPVGILALALMYRFIQDPPWIRNARPPRLDMIGFGFMSLWLGCQEVLLDKGQEDDWFGSHFMVLMAVLAAIGLVVFVVRELTTRRPFVELHILKNYNFGIGVVLMFLAGVVLYGLTADLPLFLQTLMGYTATRSGYAMAPRGIGALLMMPIAGKLVNKIQGRYLVAGGFLVYGAASLVLAGISLQISPSILFWPVVFTGVGISFLWVPLNTVALGGVPSEQMANASGIFNLVRNVGGSVGISLVTTLVARSAQAHQTDLVAHLTPFDPAYRANIQTMTATFAAHGGAVTAHQRALAFLYHELQTQANLLAYLDNFRFFALVCCACIAGSLLLKNVRVKGPLAVH